VDGGGRERGRRNQRAGVRGKKGRKGVGEGRVGDGRGKGWGMDRRMWKGGVYKEGGDEGGGEGGYVGPGGGIEREGVKGIGV